jgi:hypothetical protein
MRRVTSGFEILAVGRLEVNMSLSSKPKQNRNIHVVLLDGRDLVEGTEDLIKSGESTLSPDYESTKVTTRSELEEVEPLDVNELYTRDVAESLHDTLILAVNNERSTALTVPAVPHLALASTELAGVGNFDNVGVSLERLQESDSLLGLGERLGGARNDERNFLDLFDTVATSEDEGGKGRGGEGRDDSEAALVPVNFDVPLAPGFCGSKHAPATAHVTEGSLEIS